MTEAFPAERRETLKAALEQALRAALAPDSMTLVDDSAAHAGHEGARTGAHFSLRIVSRRFEGLPRVARHRLVYDAVRPWMTGGVHALVIEARAPDED
jgi:BolA protein